METCDAASICSYSSILDGVNFLEVDVQTVGIKSDQQPIYLNGMSKKTSMHLDTHIFIEHFRVIVNSSKIWIHL